MAGTLDRVVAAVRARRLRPDVTKVGLGPPAGEVERLVSLFHPGATRSLKRKLRDLPAGPFPGSPVATALQSQCRDPGSIPGQGNRSSYQS